MGAGPSEPEQDLGSGDALPGPEGHSRPPVALHRDLEEEVPPEAVAGADLGARHGGVPGRRPPTVERARDAAVAEMIHARRRVETGPDLVLGFDEGPPRSQALRQQWALDLRDVPAAQDRLRTDQPVPARIFEVEPGRFLPGGLID